MSEGDTKRAKKEPLSPEDIARLPIDVRVEVLSRVDRLEDLFALGRQMPVMKAFMKKYDVFGKWFRYHTGLSVDEADDFVKDVVRSFKMNGGGPLHIEWGQFPYNNHINIEFTPSGVLFITDVNEIAQMYGKNITRGKSMWIPVPVAEEPMLFLIRMTHFIDRKFPQLRRRRFEELTNFSHQSPFDLLSLVTLSLSLNEFIYSPNNSNALRVYGEVRENLRDGSRTVSQVFAYKNGRFRYR